MYKFVPTTEKITTSKVKQQCKKYDNSSLGHFDYNML